MVEVSGEARSWRITMLDRVLMFMGKDQYIPPEYDPTIFNQLFSTGNGTSCTISKSDTNLVITHDAPPYLRIFIFSNGSPGLIPTTNYAQPSATAWDAQFSPDGTHLVVAHNGSPFASVYGVSGTTFTKLPDLSPSTGEESVACCYSPDGTYLAFATKGVNGVSVYKRTGSSYQKINNIAPMVGGFGSGVAFSPDGEYMAVSQTAFPYITIYRRDGDDFSISPNQPQIEAVSGNGVSFSPDGSILLVCCEPTLGGSSLLAFRRNVDEFDEFFVFDEIPNTTCNRATFTQDGYLLAVTSEGSPYIHIYKKDGGEYVKDSQPTTIPSSSGRTASFTSDGKFMALSCYKTASSPTTLIYKNY